MIDSILQILIITSLLITNFFVIRHTRRWANPLSIISVVFFLPLLFSLSRLSGLQAESWDYETYTVIVVSLIFWILFPTLYLLVQKVPAADGVRYESDQPYMKSRLFQKIARWFAVFVGSFYFLANVMQAGSLLPLLQPEIALLIHTEFPPMIRLIARANPAATALLFISYFYNRKKFDLILLTIVYLVPLTRLSRIDLVISSVMLIILNTYFPLVRLKAKGMIAAICILAAIIVVGVDLGNQRTNRFGLYDVKYEDAILWKPTLKGPLAIFPSLYGVFPLGFENFDAFVISNKNHRTYGLQSLDWLFTGIFKVNLLRDFEELKSGGIRFKAISSAANVPTTLYPFYADFGAVGSAVPLFFYMLIWLEFYRRANSSPLFAALYALYAGGFALSTFQAIIVSPLLVQQLFEIWIIFLIVRRAANG